MKLLQLAILTAVMSSGFAHAENPHHNEFTKVYDNLRKLIQSKNGGLAFCFTYNGEPRTIRDRSHKETRSAACKRHGFTAYANFKKFYERPSHKHNLEYMKTLPLPNKKLIAALSPLAFEYRVLDGAIDHILFADIYTTKMFAISDIIGADVPDKMVQDAELPYSDVVTKVLKRLRESSTSKAAIFAEIDEDLQVKIEQIEAHLTADHPRKTVN